MHLDVLMTHTRLSFIFSRLQSTNRTISIVDRRFTNDFGLCKVQIVQFQLLIDVLPVTLQSCKGINKQNVQSGFKTV